MAIGHPFGSGFPTCRGLGWPRWNAWSALTEEPRTLPDDEALEGTTSLQYNKQSIATLDAWPVWSDFSETLAKPPGFFSMSLESFLFFSEKLGKHSPFSRCVFIFWILPERLSYCNPLFIFFWFSKNIVVWWHIMIRWKRGSCSWKYDHYMYCYRDCYDCFSYYYSLSLLLFWW